MPEKRARDDGEEGTCGLTVSEAEALGARLAGQLSALKAQVEIHLDGWKTRLETVQKAVAPSNAQLAELAKALALERYGHAAEWFAPEPPPVTTLVALSARDALEISFARDADAVVAAGAAYKKLVLQALGKAKPEKGGEGDGAAAAEDQTCDRKQVVRELGKCLNAITASMRAAQRLDRVVGNRISMANKRLFTYRSAAAVREGIDPSRLCDVPPTVAGYTKVLDFYRLTDARLYSFGRQFEGPQHFVDIKRNVAILSVWRTAIEAGEGRAEGNGGEELVYNNHAVSGENAVGAPNPNLTAPIFDACACEDGLGEVYNRAFDAEFKLITQFVAERFTAAARYRAVLWSKKPLCASCSDVLLKQVPARCPTIALTVVIDEE